MKFKKVTAGLALSFMLVGALSAPASANNAVEAPSIEELPPLPQGVPDLGVSNEELVVLAENQSPDEIDAILESGKPTVSLVDDDGNVIAVAEAEAPKVSTRAISIDSPYTCASRLSSACIYTTTNSATPYKGTGSLKINVSNVSVVAAGSIPTTFTRDSGTKYWVGPGGQTRMVNAARIVNIAR